MSAALCSHLFQVEETKKAQEELKQRAKEARQQMRDLEKDPCDADCDSALWNIGLFIYVYIFYKQYLVCCSYIL